MSSQWRVFLLLLPFLPSPFSSIFSSSRRKLFPSSSGCVCVSDPLSPSAVPPAFLFSHLAHRHVLLLPTPLVHFPSKHGHHMPFACLEEIWPLGLFLLCFCFARCASYRFFGFGHLWWAFWSNVLDFRRPCTLSGQPQKGESSKKKNLVPRLQGVPFPHQNRFL